MMGRKEKMNKLSFRVGAIVTGLVIVGGIIFGIMSLERIKAGYSGIVYNINGGVEDKTLPQGWHLVAPWKKVTQYSIATEQAFLSQDSREGSKGDDSFGIPSSDGKLLNVDLEFSYRFDADKLPETFTRFKGQNGKQIEEAFIRAKMKSWSGEVSSRYTVMEIYGEKRAALNKAVYEYTRENFAPYGISIDSVNFSRIGIDAATEKSIQDKVNSQQALEKSKIEAEKAKIDAQKLIIEAQAKADAILIEAEGQAKANEALRKSLTPEVVEYFKAQKWDGKLPISQGGTSILDTRSITGK
jgi:regulator of protease activity HflC (stomatin/prohibitin superfamily)